MKHLLESFALGFLTVVLGNMFLVFLGLLLLWGRKRFGENRTAAWFAALVMLAICTAAWYALMPRGL